MLLEPKDVISNDNRGGMLSLEQAAIGLNLKRYYFRNLDPMPAGLQQLFEELQRREAGSH